MSKEPGDISPIDPDYDWEADALTPVYPVETMAELMETLRSPGVPTITSDKPTKPIRPTAIRRATEGR